MRKEVIYSISSLNRDDFRVTGFYFGEGDKALCIVGAMRGNEYQQIYVTSRLVKTLKRMEELGKLPKGKEILVIPCVNPYSMNIEKRFWPTDNSDINRMFPGYSLGETTQRIAAGVFNVVSEYENGIQFASFYMPGKFCPHVRMMKTGFENVDKARQFGLPYVVLREPKPYETTTLNYNWQIWETDAFSIYGTMTDDIDEAGADDLVNAVLNFMRANELLEGEASNIDGSKLFMDSEMLDVRTKKSGIFRGLVSVNEKVKKGQALARIYNALDGELEDELTAPDDGIVFFMYDKPMVYSNTAAIKIVRV